MEHAELLSAPEHRARLSSDTDAIEIFLVTSQNFQGEGAGPASGGPPPGRAPHSAPVREASRTPPPLLKHEDKPSFPAGAFPGIDATIPIWPTHLERCSRHEVCAKARVASFLTRAGMASGVTQGIQAGGQGGLHRSQTLKSSLAQAWRAAWRRASRRAAWAACTHRLLTLKPSLAQAWRAAWRRASMRAAWAACNHFPIPKPSLVQAWQAARLGGLHRFKP